ncbi:MAG: SDR family NAD(P)-dependent oxidoreductase [Hyphomicrobiaceae bacterium]
MDAAANDGQVVLVTGGASGIGLATAEHLIAAGAKVAIFDLAADGLAAVRSRYTGIAQVRADALDVTDEAAVERAVAAAESELGPITGVVNSAGISTDVPTLDTPADLFRRILDVNVVGTFLVGRTAARRMTARRHGAIVNIASISGLRGSKGRAAYGASKGAVITLTKVMANDLARYGLRVNAVAPGPVETPMVKALHTAEDRAIYRRFVPMRRYAEPAEIARVVAFLLDDKQASYITGEILAVDGGFRGAGIIEEE